MLNKIIVVDGCEHCPLREQQYDPIDGDHHICTHPSVDGMVVDAAVYHEQIDVECPLVDEVVDDIIEREREIIEPTYKQCRRCGMKNAHKVEFRYNIGIYLCDDCYHIICDSPAHRR